MDNTTLAEMDARQARTRAKLFAAILELAGESRAEDIGVTELAALAHVHRSTVYEFAPSPAALLRAALEFELDDVRAQYLTDVSADDLPEAIRLVTRAVLVHVTENAAVYRRGLAAGGALHDFLSAHFQQSSRLLLEHGMGVPIEATGIPAETVDAMAIRYVADGTVGAIAVWLQLPTAGDPDDFLRVFTQIVPSWWPIAPQAAGSAGVVTVAADAGLRGGAGM